ncbi:MAG TPA: helix-turn-helix transcriptional regulator [Tepidisphaeraceae bacterium]|jgi:transcriptional regulator with XRE-family HTH domain
MSRRQGYTAAVLDTKRIKSLRERGGLTLADAARAAGFSSRQGWHNVESGKQTNIKLGTLNRIAKALKTSAKDLLK